MTLRHRLGVVLLAGVGLVLAGCADDVEPPPAPRVLATVDRGPVTMRLEISPPAPTLVDLVRATFVVEYEDGLDIETPAIESPALLIIGYHPSEPTPLGAGRWQRRVGYDLEPMASGSLPLGSIEVGFVDRRSTSPDPSLRQVLATEPLSLDIAALPTAATPTLAGLKPAAAPLALPAAPPSPFALAMLVVIVFVVVVATIVLIKHYRRPPPPPPPVPPRILARAELEQLLRQDLIALGRAKPFYYELTGIVRRYLEREYGLHAPQQSTEEFLQEVARGERLERTLVVALQRFLTSADLVKYAALVPGEDATSSSVESARRIIDHEAAPAPTPALVSGAQG